MQNDDDTAMTCDKTCKRRDVTRCQPGKVSIAGDLLILRCLVQASHAKISRCFIHASSFVSTNGTENDRNDPLHRLWVKVIGV